MLKIPDGYKIIANRVVLMLVRKDGGDNPGVRAVCRIEDGEQELLRRFYKQCNQEEQEE